MRETLGLCAGMVLGVAFTGLLPELQFHSHNHLQLTLALLVGIAGPLLNAPFGHTKPQHDHEGRAHAVQLGVIQQPGFEQTTTRLDNSFLDSVGMAR